MKIKKKWKRIILALIAVPVLLVGGVILYIQSNHSEIIKAQVEKLNQETKGRISVGKSDLSLFSNFPHLSIKIENVQIFEAKDPTAPIIMDVKDIYIGFNLWDIVNKNYDIQSILVEDGVVNIIIHEDNTTNIQNSLVSNTETKTPAANIHLKKIRFKNLDIHTIDEATNTDVEKFIYEGTGGFKIKDSLIATHVDTNFELNVIKDRDTTFIRKKHFEVHTDLEFNINSGILEIQPSSIYMENGDFELEGSIDTQNDVDLDLSIKGTKPNFDMLFAFAPSDVIPVLNKYKNAGEIYFNASIQGPANKGNRPFINANFGAGKAFLENTEKGKKIDEMGFNGHFTNGENRNASTMEFSLTDMTATLERGKFNGSLFVKNFESPEIDMRLQSKFNLDFIGDFFELDQVKNAVGEVSIKMNFHDIVDIDNPKKALEKLNQAYFTELIVKDLSIESKDLPAPVHNLNVHLVMEGKEATLNQFDLMMGNSDLSIRGFLSDLPAIIHHTSIPVNTHLDITSKNLDISELTRFSALDSIPSGVDEQIKDLRLGLTFKASAKAFTESKYLPEGEFFIDSLFADLKHYPHSLHDFHSDILIDDKDLKLVDFKGFIDDSDFQLDGLIHNYAFWMQPKLQGDIDFDMKLTSNKLKLEDIFSYKGENYVPDDYRHEEFDNLGLHFTSSMHYKDSALHSIDVTLDELSTKMKIHPMRFDNFRGSIHYEDDHVLINDFHGEIGNTNFNFDLNYYLGDNLTIKKNDNYLALNANYIDFDALFDFNLKPPKPIENTIATTKDVKDHAEAFNIYKLPFSDMQFDVNVDHFIYHNIDLQNINATLRTTPDHYVYVDTLNMNAAGGIIRLKGYFNGSDPEHIYMLPDLELSNVDLDKLLFKFENFGQDHLVSENLQGKLTSHIKGKIRLYPDMVPDLDQSVIEMDVKILDGRLKNYDPMLALSDYMGDKNLQNIRFDTLQNNLKINKGKINIPAMTIESTLGHMEVSGTHDYNQNIDYYLRIPWETVRKASWQKLFGGKKQNESIAHSQNEEIIEVDDSKKIKYLNLKVKGTIDDYKISLGKKKD